MTKTHYEVEITTAAGNSTRQPKHYDTEEAAVKCACNCITYDEKVVSAKVFFILETESCLHTYNKDEAAA